MQHINNAKINSKNIKIYKTYLKIKSKFNDYYKNKHQLVFRFIIKFKSNCF